MVAAAWRGALRRQHGVVSLAPDSHTGPTPKNPLQASQKTLNAGRSAREFEKLRHCYHKPLKEGSRCEPKAINDIDCVPISHQICYCRCIHAVFVSSFLFVLQISNFYLFWFPFSRSFYIIDFFFFVAISHEKLEYLFYTFGNLFLPLMRICTPKIETISEPTFSPHQQSEIL